MNFIEDEGADLTKGDEVGYFAFGSSDFILLFEDGKVILMAGEKNTGKAKRSVMLCDALYLPGLQLAKQASTIYNP